MVVCAVQPCKTDDTKARSLERRERAWARDYVGMGWKKEGEQRETGVAESVSGVPTDSL